MNKKQIEGQLKLSKKQNEDERSDYLCSQFNCVDYLINLEKYTNNLLRKNKKQQEVIDKAIEFIEEDYYSKNTTDIDSIILSNDKLLQIRKILKCDKHLKGGE